jgi:uncharacterized protein (TIGR02246 family)
VTRSAAPTYEDEVEIRSLYQRMLDSWGDSAAFANCFTPDADYVVGHGMLEKGWQEIVDGHNIIFSAWARNSSLVGHIHSIRFLTSDVAYLLAYGHIVYNDNRSSDGNKRTIYSLVAQKKEDGWIFVAYQNTPLPSKR